MGGLFRTVGERGGANKSVVVFDARYELLQVGVARNILDDQRSRVTPVVRRPNQIACSHAAGQSQDEQQ